MVTTRRQSKDSAPIELPLVKHQKRKRSDDAESAPSTAQPPKQLSTKRRKKVKSTAKVEKPPMPTDPASAAPTKAPPSRPAKKSVSEKAAKVKTHKQTNRADDAVQPSPSHIGRTRKPAELNLIQDSDSSENERVRRTRPEASRDADDDDADSRYTLGPRRRDKGSKPAAPTARRTAELKFEDDGLEEVDKAEAAVAHASARTSQRGKKPDAWSVKPVNGTKTDRTGPAVAPQANGQGKSNAKQRKVAPPAGIAYGSVMFSVVQAIAALALFKDGTNSVPAEFDPQSRQPYEPLQTGDFLSYPVKGKYHLGAVGRYGEETKPILPFSLTVPLSEYSIIQHTQDVSTAEPSRHGLGFSSSLPTLPQASTARRPNNYCFTWGKFRGRRMDSVPVTYLRSIFNSDEYHADVKLQKAFADLYPKGLYESEAESYTFEKGGFKGKRLDEVPKSYLWGLLRKINSGEAVGGKKGRGRLERALEVWEKGQLDLTKD